MATFGFAAGVGTTVSSTEIENDSIVDADVNSAAAIAQSKLALSITNTEVNTSAGIVDTKLATITTAGKVDGAAITGLANLPVGAGVIPAANVASALSVKCGVITRAMDAASGAVTTAHGLGVTPKFIRITALYTDTSASPHNFSVGTYNGTTTASIYHYWDATSANSVKGNSSSDIVRLHWDNNARTQTAVPTFDATNITLTWTRTGTTQPGTAQILWEAFA